MLNHENDTSPSSHDNHQSASGPGQGTPSAAKRINLRRVPPLRCAPRRLRERRGVLLLVVLSVLVLFVLLTITYVIVATKERSAAKASARLELSGDPPNQLCDSLMMVLLRDTADIHSPFRSWSLLEGIYGNLSFRGQLGGNATVTGSTGGQFLDIPLGNGNVPASFHKEPNYYAGCVLTMVNGPCAGTSTRVLGSDANHLVVMRFKTDAGIDANSNKYLDPLQGNVFVVNGPAYSGMGRGYDPTYDPTNAMSPRSAAPCGYLFHDTIDNEDRPYALLPNSAYFQSTTSPPNGVPPYLDPAGMAGANVDYTAHDYNSIYLGLVTNGASGLPPVLPSFHSAELCRYWANQPGGVTSSLARKILFRPTTFDHPIFNATTNPNFDPTRFDSPLDVDNMGTGIPDSIWIDPGLPVMTSKDGRSYKVMIAPLILDLDGRINVNAHGSYTQLDPSYPANGQSQSQVATAGIAGGGQAQLQPGEGVGPADVNLRMMFSQQDIQNLLYGNLNSNPNGFQGRHGAWPSSTASRPLAALKLFEGPPNDFRSVGGLTAYGTPIDLKGRRYMALDYRGLPLYLTLGAGDPNDSFAANGNPLWQYEVFGDSNQYADSPYGFNLFAPKPARAVPSSTYLDNPFTVAELERVMRPNDIDNRSLAPRLATLLQQTLQSNPVRAVQMTTEQWHVPVPSLAVPRVPYVGSNGQPTDYRKTFAAAGQTRAFQITDLVRARLTSTQIPKAAWDAEVSNILPADLIAGLQMDINRPFGNGRDDNQNGVVDDVLESTGNKPEAIQKNAMGAWPSSYPSSVPLSLTNGNGAATNDPLLTNNNIPAGWKSRQLMARYLYTLMMLFTDQGYVTWINPLEDQPPNTPLNAVQKQELTSRRVAQWAINTVCFRDSTSAMTPFVYHAQMFSSTYTGWKVNGDPGDQAQQSITDRRVVWGCKAPDLVLTETAAFHDLRRANTKFDGANNDEYDKSDPKNKDIDYDQTRVPQGSLFFELYCCRNPNNPIAPGDLYTYDQQKKIWKLDLGRMSPDNQYPVWRAIVTESPKSGNLNANVVQQMANHPDTFCAQTEEPAANNVALHLNLVDNSIVAKADRIIWFGQTPPAAGIRPNTFYNRNGATYLFPDQYAVVGPRRKTAVGSTGTTPYGQPSGQTISLTPNPTTAGTSSDPTAANIKQPLGVIVAADAPSGANGGTAWTDAAHKKIGIGLNVSEPLPDGPNYYPEPTIANPSALDPSNKNEFYGDPAGDQTNHFLDTPLEGTVAGDTKALARPLVKDGVAKTGTYDKYKHVFLQRLADPLLPWDAHRNPYITVDSMPIDLTTFNGEQPYEAAGSPKEDPDDKGADPSKTHFASRQRGGSDPANNMGQTFNLWAPVQGTDALPLSKGAGNGNFAYGLQHTLSYLNQAYGPGFGAGAPSPQYLGDPQKPFPWITWNARPYANVMELLLVPASSADRLLMEFSSPGTTTTPQPGLNPYGYSGANGAQDFRYPFGHLLNFLHSTDQNATPGKSANFYRILDYLRVPSKFVGTETLLNPTYFDGSAANLNKAPFVAPFNSVSNYRDPGLVNPNTVTSPDVWNAVMNNVGMTNFGPNYQQWADSRRGDNAASGALLTQVPALPTSFAGALRSAASADLVPLPSMMRPAVTATMLRPNQQGNAPLFGSAANMDYNNASRNAFFAYQPLERISNLVTPRSNVFAVWITIGYFEVLPWPQKGINPPANQLTPADIAAHADGYQLGAELGSDTGDIVRHRAFYIIDRSIPVGYERGQNHNVNRAVLLRRYIE